METPKTNQYLLGMQAINNFYAMLYQAMKVAMPKAVLCTNGAYVWRGFQIKKFEDLAENQYYCQIYPSENNLTSVLIFKESYIDPSIKSIDGYEEKLGLYPHPYCYPFRVSLDLYRTRFFLMDVDDQYLMLENFVRYAVQQALIWQRSDIRTKITSEEFLNGAPRRSFGKYKPAGEMKHVGIEFMEAWRIQHKMFESLQQALTIFMAKKPEEEKDWIRKNASPYHFNFRGCFMKSEKLLPDEFDIRWIVNFIEPEFLKCITSKKEFIDQYNLVKHNYFDLPEDQQRKELTGFIKKCLDRF